MSITDFAVNKLKQKGHLYFEINQYLGRETQQLLLDVNFASIALLRDINGNDRILTGVKQ